jgi:RNA polymerase sigma-70 factor (ECF subfamily)
MSSTEFKDGLIKEIPNLRAFAASLSGSIQLADDLVQDTLLKAWGNSEKFEPGTSLRAWLFTILRNTYYSLYRKRGREVQDSEGTYAERMATRKAISISPISARRSPSSPRSSARF